MKNIDRIKQMDVKEFLKFLGTDECDRCSYKDKDCGSEMCNIGIEEWLNQECELTINDIRHELKIYCDKIYPKCIHKHCKLCELDYIVNHFNIIDGKITRR